MTMKHPIARAVRFHRINVLRVSLAVLAIEVSSQGVAAGLAVRVNAGEVPVVEHRVRGRLNCAYAHFTMDQAADIQVTLPRPAGRIILSPLSRELSFTRTGDTLRFTLPSPQYVVLTLDDTRLLLLADPPDDLPANVKVINVTAAPYSADASGRTDATASLQRALDDAGAAANGTVVHLPPGTYLATGVRIPSHTHFRLEKGAVLRGSDRAEDYADYPKQTGKTAISSLIRIQDARHVRVSGHGTVDARGFALAGDAETIEEVRLKARCFTVERSRHITIEGVLCREATSWTVPFFHCADVAVRRVKVINDIGPLEHSDGINLCATQRGVV
jgi:hypothetical protein